MSQCEYNVYICMCICMQEYSLQMFAFYRESASNELWQVILQNHHRTQSSVNVAKHYPHTILAIIISVSLLTLLVSIIFPSNSNGGNSRAMRPCYTLLSRVFISFSSSSSYRINTRYICPDDVHH